MFIPLIAISAFLVGLWGASRFFANTKKAEPSPQDEQIVKKRRAATLLLQHVKGGGRDKAVISLLQREMGEVVPDGIAGPRTHERVVSLLGYNVSWPGFSPDTPNLKAQNILYQTPSTLSPKPKAPQAPQAKTVLGTETKPVKRYTPIKPVIFPAEKGPIESLFSRVATPAEKPAAKLTPKTATRPDGKPPAKLTPKTATRPDEKPAAKLAQSNANGSANQRNAATGIYSYYQGGGRDRNKIRAYQQTMGNLQVDGIVGPKTKARYAQLTSFQWTEPQATPTSPRETAPNAQKTAAEDAYGYISSGGKNKDKIKLYQTEMGNLVSDGLVGPKTKSRIKELTGKTL
jgi:hypothetical protein